MFQTRGARLGFSHPFVVVEVETVRSGSHRDTGGPSEARESGLLFSQNCLSLSLSLSRLDHPRLWQEQCGQLIHRLWLMEEGAGLSESWHDPIGATVLHYSISGSELLQGLQGEGPLKQDTVGFLFCLLLFHWRFPIYLSDQVIEDIENVDLWLCRGL